MVDPKYQYNDLKGRGHMIPAVCTADTYIEGFVHFYACFTILLYFFVFLTRVSRCITYISYSKTKEEGNFKLILKSK